MATHLSALEKSSFFGRVWRARAPRSGVLPSGMKGAHPEKTKQSGSEVPGVTPRGVQPKRDQNVLGREPRTAKRRAATRSEPRCSPVKTSGEVEPLGIWRRQHATAELLGWPAHSPGVVRGGTPRQANAERGRPRSVRLAIATDGSRPHAEAIRPVEESDGPIVPMKAVKAAGGKGPCLTTRPLQRR